MKETIAKLHKNRLFTLLVWLIITFIAIITAPNVTDTLQSYSQPTFSKDSQPAQAQQLRNDWGYNLGKASTINVVYTNPNGKITAKQQTKIDNALNKLKAHQSFYSIKKIVTINTNVAGKQQLLSKDGSTQIASLDIDAKSSTLRVLTNELVGEVQVPGLKSYVTSPEIVRDVNNEKTAQVTNIILITLFVVSMLIVGIYFRSLFAPVISFITLFAAFTTSFSISTALAKHFNFAFTQYTPLEIGIATVVIGTIWNIYIYRKLRSVLALQREARYATQQTIADLRFPITIVGSALAIIFACCGFINYDQLQSLWVLGITYVVLMLAVLTLNAVFLAALGESIFWPSSAPLSAMKSHFWNRATDFSLWQPIAAFLVVLYLTLPFIYFYHTSLNFSPMTNLTQTNQAVKGAHVLQAHFSQGKATPITIYLKNDQPLDNEKYLQHLDQLTTKLQHTKGVSAAYSLTQPSGMPIEKYYVSNQLESIGLNAKQATGQLSQASNGIETSGSNLNLSGLKQQVKDMQSLVKKSNQIVEDSSSLASQVNSVAANSSVAVQQGASRRVRMYQQKINELNQSLQSVSSGISQLNAEGSVIQNYGQNSANNLESYSQQISQVQKQLKQVSSQVNSSTDQLNNIYDYLNGLQKSGAANVYYITKAQLVDTDFLQTMLNYTSQDKKITTIQVVMNNAPSSKTNLKQVKMLEAQVGLQLRGTPLSSDQVAFTGEPITQSINQSKLNHHFITLLAIVIIGILVTVFVVSRSILQPLYWTVAFIMSAITGFQLTYLTMHYVTGTNQFDWQVPILAISILTAIAAWQIIALGLSFRYTELSLLEWIRPTMASYGKIVRYILLVVIALAIGLTFGASFAMIETALIVIYTVCVYYLILPMIVTSMGKLAVTLPNKDNLLKNK
ncbi:MMPL family transporter [Lentilactobacillus buchneri]|uniref:RND superfamily drug exporter n=1 Tax=Lentilactobacillus buchneri subsp. silagei CD034 TaxID=1071400 RepID=J9VZ25_LENBU|nr:MMPL family transporter [Lentilactobacillus buchneri]MCC6101334.1 MMPL family transporter [Lactobacillus sp.]AFR99632.1 RND superfamily drug exporter [Lentilactobacillus buchneri subsp. silagei CD034]MCT2901543.1 RND transporter [Lentilactobacillus buchneri]MCT3543209.1 RND transporter [Lentilactobacillus buchneri]MCT3544160.1 RND transporter [Lentilactobacillus buchneri]